MQRSGGQYSSYSSYGDGGGGGYGSRGGYASKRGRAPRQPGYQPRAQQQMPSPWQSEAPHSNQLSELDLELEMVKRKRQMLQEQRQLLHEQQELDRLQGQRNPSPWSNPPDNRQFESKPQQSYNQYSDYSNRYERGPAGDQRGFKRPAKPSPWQDQSQPKRFASAPQGSYPQSKAAPPFAKGKPTKPQFAPKPPVSQLDLEVGPAQLPPVYKGEELTPRATLNKLRTAVNIILREMRDLYFCPPQNVKLPNYQYFALKRRVLERVQLMMMNKPVGSPLSIHGLYRQKHTAKGDLRLIESIQAMTEAECQLAPKAVGQAKPGQAKPSQAPKAAKPAETVEMKEKREKEAKAADFIRTNLRIALEKKLTEIFDKVHKIYEEESEAEKAKLEQAPDAAKETDANTEASTETTPADGDKADVEMSDAPEKPDAAEKSDALEKSDDVVMEEPAAGEKTEADAGEKAAEVPPKKVEMKDLSGKSLEAYFDSYLEMKLRQDMPKVLPRYKTYVFSILARDPAFSKFKLTIEHNPAPPPRATLRFVKIFGKPALPAKPAMKQFLSAFHPGSIKKHKTVYNLLFVGVPEDKYEALLKQDNYSFGTKRLMIRPVPQDNAPYKPENGVDSKDAAKTNGGAANESVESEAAPKENQQTTTKSCDPETLGSAMDDLDNEIDDLLTSIKEADQNASSADIADITEGNNDEASGKVDNGGTETVEESDKTVEAAEETGDIADKTDENVDGEGENVVENVDGEGEKDVENAEETEVKKAPDTPASNIRTRRSSRLPQKN